MTSRFWRLATLLALTLTALGFPALSASATPTTRIVGGTGAGAGELPWQVALIFSSQPNPYNGQFCGGSLISTTMVLTAAHCVHGETAAKIDVLAGTIRLSSGGQRIHVSKITVHPKNNSTTTAYDFAVLKLTTAAVAPAVPIPYAGTGDGAYWTPGTLATTSGWGALTESGGFPDLLQKVQVPIVSDSACQAAYGSQLKPTSMVCAGDIVNGGKDSCQGDSGGPLAVQKPDNSWLLVGVVSWGQGCAEVGYPGVYAEVVAGTAWITKMVGGGGTSSPPTVTALSPTSGPGAGGTTVNITGTNLSGATAVRFGATAAAKMRVLSSTSAQAISPAGTGTVQVTVTTGAGTSATGAPSAFTYT